VRCGLPWIPEEHDHDACDSCGLVLNALTALTRFCVELCHLEWPLQFCADCYPDGAATVYDGEFRIIGVEAVLQPGELLRSVHRRIEADATGLDPGAVDGR